MYSTRDSICQGFIAFFFFTAMVCQELISRSQPKLSLLVIDVRKPTWARYTEVIV
jgi:hypothetical protein